MTKLTASKIEPGMVIRRYAPYTWWLDWQRVTGAEKLTGGRIRIVREDGSREVSSSARFEIQAG